jgi:hypothetical protein
MKSSKNNHNSQLSKWNRCTIWLLNAWRRKSFQPMPAYWALIPLNPVSENKSNSNYQELCSPHGFEIVIIFNKGPYEG